MQLKRPNARGGLLRLFLGPSVGTPSPGPGSTRRFGSLATYSLYALLLLAGYFAGTTYQRLSASGNQHTAAAVTSSGEVVAAPSAAAVAGGLSHRSFKLTTGIRHLGQSLEEGIDHLRAHKPPSPPDLASLLASLPPANRTLRFAVCNGFANQRLSVLYGMILAKRLGRAAVIPDLVDNGLQRTDANVLASDSNKVPFSEVYDVGRFVVAMAGAGVRALQPAEAPPPVAYAAADLGALGWDVAAALGGAPHAQMQHLQVGCPLFKIQPGDLKEGDEAVMWAALEAMQPAQEAAELVDSMSRAILRAGRPGAPAAHGYNFLHLRIENDWVEHCKRWESIRDGIVRDNCYRHTETVDEQLVLFGFAREVPLYVGSFWDDVEPERRERVMSRLRAAGYSLVTAGDVFPPALGSKGREYKALVEYFVAAAAHRFIGNGVSTFAALAMLERRHAGRWAAYYNGGNLPLGSVLPPLHRLPWVFTYNSWSPQYDYMLKGAVRSAVAVRSFTPYCIFDGNASSPIAAWLGAQGVTLIHHEPSWRAALLERAATKAKDNVAHSHLYKTPDMLVSTFQRVDLPVVPLLDQYTYALYTDADVYFRRPVTLDDFGLPLPASVSMSYEFVNMFPYNAGVILANLPTMRRNYDAFIKMMLDNDNGLYYPNYGPADQGIINKFYESDLRGHMLNQAFNAKPYNAFDPGSFILHFHGPKPHEFVSFVDSGKCDFFSVCENGFMQGLCPYTREWGAYLADEPIATRLQDACTWLYNPTVFEVMRKKWGANGGGIPEDKRAEFLHELPISARSFQQLWQQAHQETAGTGTALGPFQANQGAAAAGGAAAASGGGSEAERSERKGAVRVDQAALEAAWGEQAGRQQGGAAAAVV